MDINPTTTFIPKRIDASVTGNTIAKKQASPRVTSFITSIALLVLVVTIFSGGGVYLYKNYTVKNIATMKETIERAEKAFEPSLILELVRLDTRLKVSSLLLARHTAFSPLFRSLEQATLPDISFTAFQFRYEEGVPFVQMKGVATRYTPIAQQSEVLGRNNLIVDHIFSNFALTPAGRVTFDLDFALQSNLLLFAAQSPAPSSQIITQ